MESQVSGIETAPQTRPPVDSLRFRRPDRSQMRMVPLSLDETIPAEHHVRVLWDVVERLDLSEFSAGLKVRCMVLWSALAYNLMHFGKALLMD